MSRRTTTSRAPTGIDKAVGARIRQLRLVHNMTLADLGAELGISHQQLQKYETGTNRLSAGMLHDVAAALRTDIPDLFATVGGEAPGKRDPHKIDRDACHRIVDRASDTALLSSMRRVLTALASTSN